MPFCRSSRSRALLSTALAAELESPLLLRECLKREPRSGLERPPLRLSRCGVLPVLGRGWWGTGAKGGVQRGVECLVGFARGPTEPKLLRLPNTKAPTPVSHRSHSPVRGELSDS